MIGHSPDRAHALICMLEEMGLKVDIPTQSCVLARVTTILGLVRPAARRSIWCSNRSRRRSRERQLRDDPALLREARKR
jgi:ethanolamine ammonia-lyase large subunit